MLRKYWLCKYCDDLVQTSGFNRAPEGDRCGATKPGKSWGYCSYIELVPKKRKVKKKV